MTRHDNKWEAFMAGAVIAVSVPCTRLGIGMIRWDVYGIQVAKDCPFENEKPHVLGFDSEEEAEQWWDNPQPGFDV